MLRDEYLRVIKLCCCHCDDTWSGMKMLHVSEDSEVESFESFMNWLWSCHSDIDLPVITKCCYEEDKTKTMWDVLDAFMKCSIPYGGRINHSLSYSECAELLCDYGMAFEEEFGVASYNNAMSFLEDMEDVVFVGDHYSKEDYKKIVIACKYLGGDWGEDDELWVDGCPEQSFDRFLDYIREMNIVDADELRDEVLKCDCSPDNFWLALDCLYDMGISQEQIIDLLCDYVDKYPEFAEKSYQGGKLYLEECESEDFEDLE